MNVQPPSIGRIIHAVIKAAHGALVTRPAIIVRTWGGDSLAVQAQVFTDGENDGLPNTVWKSSLGYCETPIENSWHWPQRD